MTSTSGIHGSQGVGFQTLNFSGLGPEMMLAYMQSNLQSYDDQIAGILDDMNARRASVHEVNEHMRELRALQARAVEEGLSGGARVNPEADARVHEIEDDIAQLDAQIALAQRQRQWGMPSTNTDDLVEQRNRLQADLDQVKAENPTVHRRLLDMGFSKEDILSYSREGLSADDFKAMLETMDSRLSELNGETEYDSMRVGALIDKRSQLIQLTSNVMRDMSETASQVIRNI